MRVLVMALALSAAVPARAVGQPASPALVVVGVTACPDESRALVFVLRSLGRYGRPGWVAGRVPCDTLAAFALGSFVVVTPWSPCTLGLDVPWYRFWPRGDYVHARLIGWRAPEHDDFARPDVRAVLEGRGVPMFRPAPLVVVGPLASGPVEWAEEGHGRALRDDGRWALVLPSPDDLECADVPAFFGPMPPTAASIPSLDGSGCDWSSDPALALDGDLRATLESGFFIVAER